MASPLEKGFINMAERVRVLLSEEEVDAKIKAIGEQISKDYAGKSVHLVCVLKGGSFFMCELAKRITVPVSLDFMSVSSYGAGTESTGRVKIVMDLAESIQDKNVIIVGGTGLYINALLYDYRFNKEEESHKYDNLTNAELLDKIYNSCHIKNKTKLKK